MSMEKYSQLLALDQVLAVVVVVVVVDEMHSDRVVVVHIDLSVAAVLLEDVDVAFEVDDQQYQVELQLSQVDAVYYYMHVWPDPDVVAAVAAAEDYVVHLVHDEFDYDLEDTSSCLDKIVVVVAAAFVLE